MDGNIFLGLLSASTEVLFSNVLQLTDVQKYTNQNSGLNLNSGLAVSTNPALNNRPQEKVLHEEKCMPSADTKQTVPLLLIRWEGSD